MKTSYLQRNETFFLALLVDQALVDVRDNTTSGNGGLDEGIQLLVTTDSQLQMARGDTLHFKILGGVTSQLENLCDVYQGFLGESIAIISQHKYNCDKQGFLTGSQVLQNSGSVHCGGGTNTAVGSGTALQQTMNTTNRELEACETDRMASLALIQKVFNQMERRKASKSLLKAME